MSALSAVLLIYSFQFSPAFLLHQSARWHSGVLALSNIGHCRKFEEVSCTGQGNDLELIPTVNMETRHPVEGSFGSEFSSIYNLCGVMDA